MSKEALPPDFLELLTKLSRKIHTVFNQRVTAHGLTYPRARTLFRLTVKQNLTQKELASDLELEQATLVRLLDRMEENGLIERRPDPNDRRAKLIVLTPFGQEQAALVRTIADKTRNELFDGVDRDELHRSFILMEQIAGNISEWEDVHVSA